MTTYSILGNRGDIDGEGGCGSLVIHVNDEPAFEISTTFDHNVGGEVLRIQPVNRMSQYLDQVFFGDGMALIEIRSRLRVGVEE